jgi:hypothetical protein
MVFFFFPSFFNYLFSQDKETAYSKLYPHLNTISIGPNDIDLSAVGNQARHLDNAGFFNRLYSLVHKDYDYSKSFHSECPKNMYILKTKT